MKLDVPIVELMRLIEVLLDAIENPKQLQDNCLVWNIVEMGQAAGLFTDSQFTATVVSTTVISAYLEGLGVTGPRKVEVIMSIYQGLQQQVEDDPNTMPTYCRFMNN